MAAEGEAVHDNAPTNGNVVYSEKALHVLYGIYISAEETVFNHATAECGLGMLQGRVRRIFALSAHVKCV